MKEQPRATLRIFEIVILNTKSHKNFCTKNFTYTKKFYVFEIAAVNLSKNYFLKNAKKTCKPNNRDLNCDLKILNILFLAKNIEVYGSWSLPKFPSF